MKIKGVSGQAPSNPYQQPLALKRGLGETGKLLPSINRRNMMAESILGQKTGHLPGPFDYTMNGRGTQRLGGKSFGGPEMRFRGGFGGRGDY